MQFEALMVKNFNKMAYKNFKKARSSKEKIQTLKGRVSEKMSRRR